MIPAFDIEGGVALASARAFSVATLALAFGSVLYARVAAPAGLPHATEKTLHRLAGSALAAAFLGGLVWLTAQTADLAGGRSLADIWSVLAHTLFGHLIGARLVLLAIGVVLWDFRQRIATLACCGLALALQAGHSHAVAMGGSAWLIGAAILHVLAAGAWLGALPALCVVVAGQSAPLAHQAAARFSPLGQASVGILLLTAAVQFWALVSSFPALVGTAYGWVICAKASGFAALIALAAYNRVRLTPALANAASTAKPRLVRSILAEIALGLGVVAAAGVLTELPPPMHVQPIWPFGWLPSLDAAREDPDIAREVILYGLVLATGLALLLAALVLRRRKMPAALGALAGLALAALAAPHFAPLLVPAEPTVFYRSPTGFSTASIDSGKTLFLQNCVTCHGAQGRGDGPQAKTLLIPPADLTAQHLWMHADGQLFWWLSHGIENPEGGLAMPGFANALAEDDRWALIDYIHANNAGLSSHPDGTWTTPLHAPDFTLTCGNQTKTLSALEGTALRITFGGAQTTVVSGQSTCHADDPGITTAYRIVTGAQAGAVLVDAQGWLRQFSADPGKLDPKAAAKPMPAQEAMPMNMKM